MKIKGSNADDQLRGTGASDRILGRNGDDDLRGQDGADVLLGHGGDDHLDGGAGDDKLKGGNGDDTLRGGEGDDRLYGGLGADRFVYGQIREGVDRIVDFSLDEGDELVWLGPLSGAPVHMVASGADTIVRVSGDGGATFETIAVLENFLLPSNTTPGETIVGTDGDDVLHGTTGNDTISGRDGADTINGGAGDDFLNGGSARFAVDPNDGPDVMRGGGGDDRVHGGNGDDRLYGGSGRDYVNGGVGGDDRVDGEHGDDRVSGGFRGPDDTPGTPIDQDVLIGGSGHDVFESRFWIKTAGWDGMDTTTLGGNVDLVADFVPGVDRIDAVVYREAAGRFDFHQGGFEAFDTDGNGRLDDRDLFVTVGPETFHGMSKESITLDVGAANLAAGRLSPSEVEPGPHTLTIWGQSVLEARDFIPTNTYRGAFSTGNGTAGNDWFNGRAASTVIDGRAGDDLMTGGGGRDVFSSRYSATEQPGADRVADFLRGEDLLDGWFSMGPSGPSGNLNFAALDDNENGVLDDGDGAVRIIEASAYEPGEAPRAGVSTAIDLDVAYGFSSAWSGANSVTIIGVTGLTGDDFVDPGAASIV